MCDIYLRVIRRFASTSFCLHFEVLPGCCYGLSHFLKGDKEHLRQVICESAQGLAYTLFAKDVAAHLSHKERLQVVKTAAAEEAFFRQRCCSGLDFAGFSWLFSDFQ